MTTIAVLIGRRVAGNWRLMAALALGFVIAVGLMSATVIYADALDDLGLDFALDRADSEDINVVVYAPGGEALVRQLIRMPRNPAFDFTLLAFLWYQHAVVSGYGMVDDFKLGVKNLGQIFGKREGGVHRYGDGTRKKNQFLDTLDTGLDAGV